MRYGFLPAASALVAWARRLVTDLNTRDQRLEQELAAIRARLDAGGL